MKCLGIHTNIKRYYILLLCLLFRVLTVNSQGFNSLDQEGLKGDVKSIKTICYNASEYNGSICKNNIITYDYEIGLYPISKYEYNIDLYKVNISPFTLHTSQLGTGLKPHLQSN